MASSEEHFKLMAAEGPSCMEAAIVDGGAAMLPVRAGPLP